MKLTKVEKARRARIKAGKARASDIYSSKRWSSMYRDAKKFARLRGIENPYGSRKEYIEAYLSAKEAGEARVADALRRGIKQGVPDRHSIQFFDYQYQKMMKYAEEKGLKFPWRSKREFISDYRATKMANSSSRPLDEMRYFMKYKTSYKVALAEYRTITQARADWQKRKQAYDESLSAWKAKEEEVKDVQERMDAGEIFDQDYLESLPAEPEEFDEKEPENFSFRDLKKMSTKEFAEANKDLLREAYHKAKADGMNSKDAKAYVSTTWFGSP